MTLDKSSRYPFIAKNSKITLIFDNSLSGFKNVRRSRGRRGNGQRSGDSNGRVQRLDVLLEGNGEFEVCFMTGYF